MSLLTIDTPLYNDSGVTEIPLAIEQQELETRQEVFNAIGEVEQLMHKTYQARRWGVTDYLPGTTTRDLDMFAMRLADGGAIEELVARSEVRSVSLKTVQSTYAVDLFADGQHTQQLKLTDDGGLEVNVWQYADDGEATMYTLDDTDALNALYEFRYRMNIARDRVDRRDPAMRAAADADAYEKLTRFVYGADMAVASPE